MATTWMEWLQDCVNALAYEVASYSSRARPAACCGAPRCRYFSCMVLMLPAISAQRFVIGGLECDLAMFLILTLTPTCLVVLTCIAGAGKGGMLDIEEELRRMHSAGKGKRRPPSGAGDAGGMPSGQTNADGATAAAGQSAHAGGGKRDCGSRDGRAGAEVSLRQRPKTGTLS